MYLERSAEEFERVCDECNAVLKVIAPRLEGHNEPEEYYCPVCRHEYKVRASNSPRVELISRGSIKQSNIDMLNEHKELIKPLEELIIDAPEGADVGAAEKVLKDLSSVTKKSLDDLSK